MVLFDHKHTHTYTLAIVLICFCALTYSDELISDHEKLIFWSSTNNLTTQHYHCCALNTMLIFSCKTCNKMLKFHTLHRAFKALIKDDKQFKAYAPDDSMKAVQVEPFFSWTEGSCNRVAQFRCSNEILTSECSRQQQVFAWDHHRVASVQMQD